MLITFNCILEYVCRQFFQCFSVYHSGDCEAVTVKIVVSQCFCLYHVTNTVGHIYNILCLYRVSVSVCTVYSLYVFWGLSRTLINCLLHHDISNYRPVLWKVMQSLIRDHIMDYFLSNNFFCDSHYDFIRKISTTLQLLKLLAHYIWRMEGKQM